MNKLMPESLEIQPHVGMINARIRPPGSKSITNRALLIAAIARGRSTLAGILESEDTQVMIESLSRLGVPVQVDRLSRSVDLQGCQGNFPNTESSLFVENSGTTIRFLTAVLGIVGGRHRLDGVQRMRERPIGPLVNALNALSANVKTESPNQSPPVVIDSKPVSGGRVVIQGGLSSQFLSGLLMAAPLCKSGLTIDIEGELISKPYVQMTLEMMRSFGVSCLADQQLSNFSIGPGQAYLGRRYEIEPDASAASYFWAAAAICGGTSTVTGLNSNSIQGDIRFARVLEQMGCRVFFDSDSISVTGPALHGIDVNMGDISDTVQTLAAVAPFVDSPTTVRHVEHNRVKETDRIGFLAIELRKLGLRVTEFSDGLTIYPGPLAGAVLETYHDHRMAMSLSLIGLRVPGVIILNPSCAAKTYPNFFSDMAAFCRGK
jgi:3-phosphoshikimate 1-carboxyvinyltransferase